MFKGVYRLYNSYYNRFNKADKGFTLVEVLVAMTIILVVLMAYSTLFTTSFEGIFRAGHKSEELFWAQGNIETLIAKREEGEGKVIELEFENDGREIDVWGRSQEVSSLSTFLSEEKDPVRYVAVGDRTILSSALGVEWIKTYDGTETFVDVIWGGVGVSDKGYLALGSNGELFTSTNGHEWGEKNRLDGTNWNAVTWGGIWGDYTIGIDGNFNYVAVGNEGKIMYSDEIVHSDGFSTWSPAEFVYSSDKHLYGVGWGAIDQTEGNFVAVGAGGKILTWTGNEGDLWQDNSISSLNANLNDVVWAQGRYVVVGDSGLIITSTDAETWIQIEKSNLGHDLPDNFEVSLKSITYGIGYFAAVGDSGTVLISNNGLEWHEANNFSIQDLSDVTWSYNRFVAVGPNTVLTSFDATNWAEVENYPNVLGLSSVTGR